MLTWMLLWIPLILIAVLALFTAAAPWLLAPKVVGPAVAPDPQQHPEAVIQIYGADVWGIRGRFAIHTWVAVKPEGAQEYSLYQVIGWRLRRQQSVVSARTGVPNAPWFGAPPQLLLDVRGERAAALASRVQAAVASYPFADEYVMYPGPNSNSFTQWIALRVPELGLQLPFKALGKGWMLDNYDRFNPP